MKKLFGTTALVLSLAIPAVAQDATSPYLAGLERGVRASDFIGKRVYVTEADTTGLSDTALAQANADWEDAGEISDIIISMAGDNEAVLVDFGGFLGIGEKTVAVSMASLTMVPDSASPDDYFLVFQGNKAALESAPVFDENMVFDATVALPKTALTRLPDTTATDTTATDTTATDTTMAPVQEAGTAMGDGEMVDYGTMSETDLIGKRVYGPNGEDVGEISAVAIGADNKITAAVVDVGGFLGMGEKPVALTSDMLRFVKDPNSDEAVFTVTATQEQLEAMPNYAN
jgi:sporulation protein YlmC with PRC-barrel domain